MGEEVVHVACIWFLVVFSAETDETFVSDESDRELVWILPYLRNHHIDPQIKLLPIKQQWVS